MQHLLFNAYYSVPGAVLGTGNRALSNEKNLCFHGACILEGRD